MREASTGEAAISTLAITPSRYDFSPIQEAMQKYVDAGLVSGLAAVILKGTEVVDFRTWGHADIESQRPLREDAIFRYYSGTKIITSAAVMMLHDEGAFRFDDPVAKYIPQFAGLRVLKPGATEVTDTEPLVRQPTIRELISHQSGFTYGLFPETPVDKLYTEQRIMDMNSSLEEMIDKLAGLPLIFQPGARWNYSIGIDILGRLIEIWSGKSFRDFLHERLFAPLGMVDTDFHVPEAKHARLTTNYQPLDLRDNMKPGLKPCPDLLIGSVLAPKRFHSGGGGLVGTIGDYTRFIQMIANNGTWAGRSYLSPSAVELMHTNLLPPGVQVRLPVWKMPDTVFGAGFAIKNAPAEGEPASAIGEYHWGGMAGTHSWIAPRANLAGLIFTQRAYGFWHPFSHEFKRLAYQIAGDAK
ncbi:MAG: beta-lactamase family protein [Gammaproteobacteria bacterium]|nr:beta-lactamase family protein [Gammaproteobacteria bacterium]